MMKTMEFVQRPDADKCVRVAVPVDDATQNYRVVVQVELAPTSQSEYLTDEFINETAGKWVGDFIIEPEGDYEERKSL
jgi:hypothetical protein